MTYELVGPSRASSRVLELDDVRKVYPVFRTPFDLLPMRRGSRLHAVALDGVSFVVDEGDVVGVIGRNGAGKSTLLRTVAGIASLTSGRIVRNGSVYPLLDVDAGLNLYLSGRKNARQRLTILGLPRHRVEDLLERVLDFAELEEVADEPVRTYSTGMRIRLAFSIATAFQPEIFLIDEVLAVGDEFFAAKSFRRIEELVGGGRAALVASHDWLQTFRLCTRLVWLEGGRIRAQGPPNELMYDYLAELNAFDVTGAVRIVSLEVLDARGTPTWSVHSHDPLTIRFQWESDGWGRPFALISGWTHAGSGESVLSAWSLDDGFVVEPGGRSGTVEIAYPDLPLAPGEYDYGVMLVDPFQGPFPVEYLDLWGPLTGHETRLTVEGERSEALLTLPARWATATA